MNVHVLRHDCPTRSSSDVVVRASEGGLGELGHGTREEQRAQGEAALGAAQAQARAEQAMLQKLDLVAPRAGRIDSIPYKLGAHAPVGAPLVVMLVCAAPHARVYVPEPFRACVAVGHPARVVLGACACKTGVYRTVYLYRTRPPLPPRF